VTTQRELSLMAPAVSIDRHLKFTGGHLLHRVSSFCRLFRVRVVGELCLRAGTEIIQEIGQFIVERCDQKELHSCCGIVHFPRLGSNTSRLLSVILFFCWRLGIHTDSVSQSELGRLAERLCRRRSAANTEQGVGIRLRGDRYISRNSLCMRRDSSWLKLSSKASSGSGLPNA
jgi:hypothetical protein